MIRKLSRKVSKLAHTGIQEDEADTRDSSPAPVLSERAESRAEGLSAPSPVRVKKKSLHRDDSQRDRANRVKKSSHIVPQIADYCEICHEGYRDPKQLQCGHVFCEVCLQPYINIKMMLDCPKCMKMYKELGGISSLPNYVPHKHSKDRGGHVPGGREQCKLCFIETSDSVQCLHCQDTFCKNCLTTHVADQEEKLFSIKSQVDENLTMLTQSAEQIKDKMTDIATEADEVVAAKIEAIHQRREKLDEELCDFLNHQNNQIERLRNASEKLSEKMSRNMHLLHKKPLDEKALILRETFAEVESLTKDIDNIVGDEIQLDHEHLSLVSKNPNFVTKGSLPNYGLSNLEDVRKLSWKGCFKPLAAEVCPWSGDIWICSSGSSEIGVFKVDGSLVTQIRHQQLIYPCSLAFHIPNRQIFIADERMEHVCVMDDEGNIINTITKDTRKNVSLGCPTKVMIDVKGRLVVLNINSSSIQVWTPEGEFKRYMGDGKEGIGNIDQPMEIMNNASGKQLAILDPKRNCIHVMSPVSLRSLYFINSQDEKILSFTWDNNNNIIVLLETKVQVHNGKTLLKSYNVEGGAVAISCLGDYIGLCYPRAVYLKKIKFKKLTVQ